MLRLAACVEDVCISFSGPQGQRSVGKTYMLEIQYCLCCNLWVNPSSLNGTTVSSSTDSSQDTPAPQHHVSSSPCTFSCRLLRSIPFTLSQLALPPFRDHYMLEWSFLPLISSTKGTLVILLCRRLLIHNYWASHRRTRCISLISLLLLPPSFMQRGSVWLSVCRPVNN